MKKKQTQKHHLYIFPPPPLPLYKKTLHSTFLRNPKPNLLGEIPRFSVGPMRVGGVQGGFARVQVRFGWVDPLGPLEDFPEGKEEEIDGDADVGGDEVVDDPRLEDVEAVE